MLLLVEEPTQIRNLFRWFSITSMLKLEIKRLAPNEGTGLERITYLFQKEATGGSRDNRHGKILYL